MRRALLFIVLLAGAGAVPAGCRRAADGQAATASPTRPNVLLVTIDTLRADHLGCYGDNAASTPTIDALARRGTRFETAIAQVPLTGPSHATILTGLTPLGHGFRNNSGFALPASVRTAAEDFRQAGYLTAAFVSGFPLDRRFGLDRGFGEYDDHLPRGNDRRRTPYVERFADATTDAVLRWVDAHRGHDSGSTWFLWVHYYDPHAPYEPPPDLRARFARQPYDGEIAFVDRELGRLLQALASRGAMQRTLTLVTADHGESLGEHGEGAHGLFLYDATLRVPWIMAGPGVPSGRLSRTVARSIDILPTLLDYAGLPRARALEGRSLRPAADGHEMKDLPAYAESLYGELELGWAPLHAFRSARFKLIEAPRPELYDLARDPAETQNRFPEEGTRAEQMRRALQAALTRPTPDATAASDAEAARKLAALGYVSGGTSAPTFGNRRDPKDGVHLMPRLNRGLTAARTEPEVAIRELSAVLAEDPGLLMARRTRVIAYESAGQYELAIADLRTLEKDGQLSPEDAVVLGDNLRFAGRLTEASVTLERAARDNPRFPQPLISLAEVRIQEQKYDEAEALCRNVLTLVPDHIEALRRLGDLALMRGDLSAADGRYSRILSLDAGDVAAATRLGVVRMRTGRVDEAIALFRRAVNLDPANADALLYLAGALAKTGRPAEALPYFERSVKAGPPSTMALNGMGLTRLALGDRVGAASAFKQSLRLDPRQPEISRTLADMTGR